jgi:hypothetical protein
VSADREIFYAYHGNTAVDLDPLPLSRARLTVVELALFELGKFEMATPIQSPAKCEVRSVIPLYLYFLDTPHIGPSTVQSGPLV